MGRANASHWQPRGIELFGEVPALYSDAQMRSIVGLIGDFDDDRRLLIGRRIQAVAGWLNAQLHYEQAPTGPEINAALAPIAKKLKGLRAALAALDRHSLAAVRAAADREPQMQMLMEAGLDENTAKSIARGRYVTSRDPISGAAQVIDKFSGQPICELNEQQAAAAEAGPVNLQTEPSGLVFDNVGDIRLDTAIEQLEQLECWTAEAASQPGGKSGRKGHDQFKEAAYYLFEIWKQAAPRKPEQTLPSEPTIGQLKTLLKQSMQPVYARYEMDPDLTAATRAVLYDWWVPEQAAFGPEWPNLD